MQTVSKKILENDIQDTDSYGKKNVLLIKPFWLSFNQVFFSQKSEKRKNHQSHQPNLGNPNGNNIYREFLPLKISSVSCFDKNTPGFCSKTTYRKSLSKKNQTHVWKNPIFNKET